MVQEMAPTLMENQMQQNMGNMTRTWTNDEKMETNVFGGFYKDC